MTQDTSHSRGFSGGFSGASIRTRVLGDHISNTQAGVGFTLLSVTCQTTLAALDNSTLTHNAVPVNTAVPSYVGTCIVHNTLPLP